MRKAFIVDFRFHDLRNTVASRLARARIPESVIAMILGHKRASMTSRYINPHWDEMASAMAILGELCHVCVTRSKKAGSAENYKENKINDVGDVNIL
jgi:hypothetical protein